MLPGKTVQVQEGQLQGKIVPNCRGGKYVGFQGIPYAKPPVGELRFKAPQPADAWQGLRDATTEGSECYSRHMLFQHLVGSENCLFLNVYTPELPSASSTLKPVMAFFHGGGFRKGSGNSDLYGPDYLLAEDVLVVTINYRVGLLGFLIMEDPSLEIPGNAALKDQILALKWIQKNISNFNGDPNNVTVFGHSTGGTAAHYLMLSPMAEGLFHRIIIQSGSALAPWPRGQPSAPFVAQALKLKTKNEREILKILQEMSVEEIYKMQEHMISLHLGPTVEKPSQHSTILSEEPIDVIRSGKFNKVPMMIGYTSREGMVVELLNSNKHGEARLVKDFDWAMPHMLNIPKDSKMLERAIEKVKHFYYGEEEPTLANINEYYLLQTDAFFLKPIFAAIELHNASSSTPIYLYRMSIVSNLNIYKKFGKLRSEGVCHADELGYLFKTVLTPKIRPGSIEDEAVRRFAKLWATFARNGDPNPVNKDPLISVTWKPVEKGQLHYLDIGENLTVGVNPEATRIAFWDNFNKRALESKL